MIYVDPRELTREQRSVVELARQRRQRPDALCLACGRNALPHVPLDHQPVVLRLAGPAPVEPAPEWLTVREAASRLTVSPMTVRRLIDRGELRGHRIGRQVKVRPADLDAYIAATAMPPRSAAR